MSISYSIGDIARITRGQLLGDPGPRISKLAIDSRMVIEPREILFFAIEGSHNDGHDYIAGLFHRGARCFVVKSGYPIPPDLAAASFVMVNDTIKALQQVAEAHRARFNLPVVAITGSNGKTIVKEWLGQALGSSEKVTRSPRSYNSQVGVPLSVWQLDETSTLAIFEAGISMPGEMELLEKVIKPDIGIITNIGPAHQENFSTIEDKIAEKLRLFSGARVIMCNRDHEEIFAAISRMYGGARIITWGRDPEASLRLVSSVTNGTSALEFTWQGVSFKAALPFTDSISVENVMPVILFMLFRGYSTSQASERIALLQPVAMRMEQKEGINGCIVINDSYNSDLTSLEIALGFLNQQALKKGGRHTLVLSDMYQTGLKDEILYHGVASLLKNKGIDRLIGVGTQISNHAGLFSPGDLFFPNTEALLQALPKIAFRNEAILVKGARAFAFERVTAMLEKKQHVTVMEIDLNAFINNLAVFREKLNPGTKILAMVKAFGYGSGSHEIASVLQHHKVDYLGVAFVDEGIELRQAGITLPIMVMNPEDNGFAQMIQFNLEPEIYSFRVLEAFYKVVAEQCENPVNIHLEVDTGMTRLGFFPGEAARLIEALKTMPLVRVKSVFTHLAGSEEEAHDNFTMQQISDFGQFCDELWEATGWSFTRHVLNSAGIERFPRAQQDMVRLGIGLYGISSSRESRLKNVVTLKTHVLQVKRIDEGQTIGYGRAGTIEPGGKVAIIPIGYADGLDRRLGNRVGEVLVKNQPAPIVGNICMDMCMVDVTAIDVEEGDEVIIFGDKLPFSTLAKKLGTIPYEILARISRRVKRVYFKE